MRSGSRRIGSFGRYRVVLIDSARSVNLCEQTPFHSRPLLEMSRFDVLPPGQQLYFLVRRRIRATPHFEEWDRVVSKCFSWSFSRKVPISRVTRSRDPVHLGSRPRTDDPSFFMRVARFKPKRIAAPLGPKRTHLVSFWSRQNMLSISRFHRASDPRCRRSNHYSHPPPNASYSCTSDCASPSREFARFSCAERRFESVVRTSR